MNKNGRATEMAPDVNYVAPDYANGESNSRSAAESNGSAGEIAKTNGKAKSNGHNPTIAVVAAADAAVARAPELKKILKEIPDDKISKLSPETIARIERECQLIMQLPEKDMKILIQAFEILINAQSTWLINVFKKLIAVKSEQLSLAYNEAEMYFDYKGTSWHERWWNKAKKKREDENIDSYLPATVRQWLVRLGS